MFHGPTWLAADLILSAREALLRSNKILGVILDRIQAGEPQPTDDRRLYRETRAFWDAYRFLFHVDRPLDARDAFSLERICEAIEWDGRSLVPNAIREAVRRDLGPVRAPLSTELPELTERVRLTRVKLIPTCVHG